MTAARGASVPPRNVRVAPESALPERAEPAAVQRASQALAAVRAVTAPKPPSPREARLASPLAAWLARRFLALWAIAVLATAVAFVAHLALRFETVRLGYDVDKARRAQRSLVEQRRLLSLEAATLGQAARVEAVARGSLGMDVPPPSHVVPMGVRTSRRAAGGVR
jgi:cell division protein FtsL